MKVIIYIKILKSTEFNFSDPDLEIIKKTTSKDVQIVDMDNHSSDPLFKMASGFIRKAERICMVINASEGWDNIPLASLLEPVISNQKPFLLISKGNSPLLEKYAAPFKDKYLDVEDLNTQAEQIDNFMSIGD